MNYDEFFIYQISNTSLLDFATWLNNEFLRSCPKELEIETKRIELFGEIVTPDDDHPSCHFYLIGLPHYGKANSDVNKNNGEMQQSPGIKDLLTIAPDLLSRSIVDFEIQSTGDDSIQVICTCKNKNKGLVEIINNLREQIRPIYNPVIVYDPTRLDVIFSKFLSATNDVLFEFTVRNRAEIFVEWCHTELAIMHPGDFVDTIESEYFDSITEDYVDYSYEVITRTSGEIIPPDNNNSVWRYVIVADTYQKDKLKVSYVAAFIEATPIGKDRCYVKCLCDPDINPEMKDWLANLEERAITVTTADMVVGGDESTKSDHSKPWMCIPDHLWDRIAIEMWCNGHTNQEIASKVKVVPRAVTNRISFLRRRYPDAHIPTYEERRKLMIQRDKP
jgi:hypothetical protein